MREETKLAPIVSSLFRDCSPHKPRGIILWQGKRERLAADRPLALYFAALNDGGRRLGARNAL